MTTEHRLTAHEVGMLRIYMKPSDKARQSRARSFFNARPLYRQLVEEAKAAGILNAIAHHTHYGYSNHGRIHGEGPEISHPDLTMCVEMIGERDQLEAFCQARGDLLKSKVIIYKHLEQWRLSADRVEASQIAPDAAEL